MRLSSNQFCETGDHTAAFDELVLHASRDLQTIRLVFMDDQVDLSLVPPTAHDGRARSTYEGTSPIIRNGYQTLGARLLLPVLSSANRVEIPSRHILSTRRPKQSVASFFARNLCFAVMRGGSVNYRVHADACIQSDSIPQTELARQYLSVLNGFIKEPILNDEDILENILISGYMNSLPLENSMLRRGLEEVRQLRKSLLPTYDRSELVKCLMHVRKVMMEHFN